MLYIYIIYYIHIYIYTHIFARPFEFNSRRACCLNSRLTSPVAGSQGALSERDPLGPTMSQDAAPGDPSDLYSLANGGSALHAKQQARSTCKGSMDTPWLWMFYTNLAHHDR